MALNLHAKVSLDGSGFESGIKRLEESGKEAFGQLKEFALQAFGVYAAGEMFRKSIDNAKELVSEAQKLGTDGVEGLQVLRQAAKDSLTDFGAVQKAFEKINEARAKALSHGEGWQLIAKGFQGLGVNDLNMSTQAMLLGPIRNAALTRSPADLEPFLKAATGMKEVSELIPFLKTDFGKLSEEMQKMGVIISTDTAVKLKLLGDEFELLGSMVLAHLGPKFFDIAEALTKFYAGLEVSTQGLIAFAHGALSGKWDPERIDKAIMAVLSGGLSLFIPGNNPLNTKEGADKASKTVNKVAEDWAKFFDDFQKRIEALKNQIQNPIPNKFNFNSLNTHQIDVSDPFVKMGNFIGDQPGGLAGIIGDIEEKKIQLLSQIEVNTRPKNPTTTGTDAIAFPPG